MVSESEIDQLLLSFCEDRWLKVAKIVGCAFETLEQRGVQIDKAIVDAIDARMAAFVGSGQLEAQGNIKKWRYSEVRLSQM